MSASLATASLPLVGMRFRPPASAIVNNLPVGTPLLLVAEPDNPYDLNAVAVMIESAQIPKSAHEAIGAAALDFGYDLGQILAEPLWHIGYIAREFAAQLRAAGVVPDGHNVPATYQFSASANQPRVRLAEAA